MAPLFLVGAERSGTTMLRLMLQQHPEIAFGSEFDYVIDLIGADGTLPSTAEFISWLDTHRIFRSSGLEIDPELSFVELVHDLLEQLRLREAKRLVGATIHRHFDRLPALWPKARYIHLLRDPRDVASSCIAMEWAGNYWTAPVPWIDAERSWDRLCLRIPSDSWIEIRYEALVSDPPAELRRICSFFGTDYDPNMLEYPRRSSYEAPDPRLAARWRDKLSPRQLSLAESRLGALLVTRGYEPSGVEVRVVPLVSRRILELHDWYSRVAFRFRRFGPRIVGLDFATRRLGLKRWHRSVQLRMNEIVERNLR